VSEHTIPAPFAAVPHGLLEEGTETELGVIEHVPVTAYLIAWPVGAVPPPATARSVPSGVAARAALMKLRPFTAQIRTPGGVQTIEVWTATLAAARESAAAYAADAGGTVVKVVRS
jgi:hypothetical protein